MMSAKAEPNVSTRWREKTMEKLIRDGVALTHETLGQADPPILLVHGWTCDHTYFEPQAEHFSRNHRVISVDVRGHGESDKPEQDYTMAGYADEVAWLCGQLAAAKPVIIGHNMGGVIAFEVAARHPGLPGAVVAVDSPICPPDAVREAIQPVIDSVKTPSFCQVSQDFVANALFLSTDDAALKHVMASAIYAIFAMDTERPRPVSRFLRCCSTPRDLDGRSPDSKGSRSCARKSWSARPWALGTFTSWWCLIRSTPWSIAS
jgi:pimeloyl-ACP methyl ester carboxylesterase